MKRWLPLTLMAICLGLMFLWHWEGPSWKLLRRPMSYLGILPMLIGATLPVLGLRQLMRADTTIKAFHLPQRLVTDGIYRYTRNPIYLGLALMLVGACILFNVRCFLIPVVIFVVIADRWVIRAEERMLLRTFGHEYDEYRGRTRRWM